MTRKTLEEDHRDDSGFLALRGGPLVLIVAGLSMLVWTWFGWADPVMDFGRELYVAWRLSEGDVLYRDIAYLNGPLSPYVNAILFRILGVGYATLVLGNLVVLAVTVAMVYGLLCRIADRTAATTACLVFLLVFAFGQYTVFANYNWLSPYSHEITHGLALAIAVVVALERWARHESAVWLVFAGGALGLAFLTKPETFLAAAVGGGVFFLQVFARRNWRALWVFTVAALAPPVAAFGLLSLMMPPGEALQGTIGAWPFVLEGRVLGSSFYMGWMGLDAPYLRIREMMVTTGWWILALGPAVAVGVIRSVTKIEGRYLFAGVFIAEMLGLLLFPIEINLFKAVRPLPIFMIATGVGLVVAAARHPEERSKWVASLALVGLAFVMLLKMVLLARVHNVGFALALSAVMVLVVAMVSWLPALLDRVGVSGFVLRAAAFAVLSFGVYGHLNLTNEAVELKKTIIGQGADAIRVDTRGPMVNDVLEIVDSLAPRSMAVLPQGAMINYLARVPNPTPHVHFAITEWVLFGDAWLDSFCREPPEVIVLLADDFNEAIFDFERDKAQDFLAWIEDSYTPVATLGRVRGYRNRVRIMTATGAGCS